MRAWARWVRHNGLRAVWLSLLLAAPALVLGRRPTQFIDLSLGRFAFYAQASSRPVFALLAGGAFAAAVVRARARRAGPPREGDRLATAFDAGLALYFVGLAVAAFAVDAPRVRMYPALAYAFVAACSLAAASFRLPARVVRWFLLGVTAVVAVGIVAEAEGFRWWPATRLEYIRRPGGFFAHRNSAGEFLALAAPACVVAAAPGCPWALVPLGAALAFTRSRTAWLVAAFGVGLLLLASSRARRRPRAIAAACVLAGALAVPFLPAALRWSSADPYGESARHLLDLNEGSGALRVAQYGATLRVAGRRLWLGLGPDQWHRVIRPAEPAVARNFIPLSEYLRSLSDGGVLSLAGLTLMLGSAGALAYRRRRALPDAPAFVASMALISAVSYPLFRLESIALWAVWTMGLLTRRPPPPPERAGAPPLQGGTAAKASRT
jgi:O-antigen ligase/polysaccharide polymerase Wzy-like membrane protein